MMPFFSFNILNIRVVKFCVFFFFIFDVLGNEYDSLMNIVGNPHILYENKIDIAENIYDFSPDEQIRLSSFLLKESVEKNDSNNIAKFYCLISHAYIFNGSIDSCKYYLDLATLLINKVTNTETLGVYNHVYGDYYNYQLNYEKSHVFYYKALDYFQNSRLEHYQKRSIPIFHNISFSYLQEKDTASCSAILKRMYEEIKKNNDAESEGIYYGLLSYYYGCKYELQKNISDLYSAIISDEKAIKIYETEIKNKDLYADEMAYRYINLANNKLRAPKPDYKAINCLAEKAHRLSAPKDTAMLSNCLWIEGLSMYNTGNIKLAELKFLALIEVLDNWRNISGNLEMQSNTYEYLSQIYTSYGDYERALFYETQKNNCNLNIYNTEKYKVIKDLHTKYETQKKDQAIRTQKQINILIICLLILIVVTGFFIIQWQKINRRMLNKQMEIIKQEKNSIVNTFKQQEKKLLEAKAREREITKTIHEKEQLINDIKLKSLEAKIEAQQEIQLLKNKKEEIYHTITSAENDKTMRLKKYNEIVSNLYNLIDRSIPDPRKKDVLNIISKIEDSSILLLQKRGLKNLDIEYAILIAAGFNISELASAYSVANQTVRVRRSKIREAFNLEASNNLDSFLLKCLIPIR